MKLLSKILEILGLTACSISVIAYLYIGDWQKAVLYLTLILMWLALLVQEKSYNKLKIMYEELFEASKSLTSAVKETIEKDAEK